MSTDRLAHLHALFRRWAPWLGIIGVVLAVCAIVLDARLGSLLRNTAWLVFGTLAVSLPLGTVTAVLIVRTDMPGRRPAAAALAAMLLVPVYLQAAAWQAGFGLQGWVTLNWPRSRVAFRPSCRRLDSRRCRDSLGDPDRRRRASARRIGARRAGPPRCLSCPRISARDSPCLLQCNRSRRPFGPPSPLQPKWR